MSSQRVNAVEKDLEKFIKFLAVKSTQVVVQSRLGEKLQTQCNPLATGNDWFNLEIQDHPAVLEETKRVLNLTQGQSILTRLPLCIEISVKTVEGDQMVLEVWSLDVKTPKGAEDKDVTDAVVQQGIKGVAASEHQMLKAAHAIYNRMGMLLKSLISLTRATPAYKLSRCQTPEAYTIYYRIYVDRPQTHLLGDGYKFLTIGELSTIVGTLKMELSYRTKMTITPTTVPAEQARTGETNAIMLKSDHFRPNDTTAPMQNTAINALAFGKKGLNGGYNGERKIVDIEKPLKPGAFVDVTKLHQYKEEDYVLPEKPPCEWLLRRTRNESDGSSSLESLNRKSESQASTPNSAGTASNNSNNNNNYNNTHNMNGLNQTNHINNTNNNNSNNNNVPSYKGNENNENDKPTTQTKSTPSSSPSNVSQSPLKRLLVVASKRHSSTSSLQPHLSAAAQDDDNLLKELNFPFASPSSHVNDLAKFYRDCYHAPPLHGLGEEIQTEISTGGSCGGGGSVGVGCGTAAVYAAVDSSDFAIIDDLSRQLEQFETSLEDYDKLVSSITGSSSTGSRSSGGGLQMSN